MIRKIHKRIISLLLSVFVLTGAVFAVPALSVSAAAPAIPPLVYYIATAIGLVSSSNNVIEDVTGTNMLNELSDLVQQLLGDGSIYVSASGEYVFNSDSTKAIYELLTNDASKNAKVVSSFPDWRTYTFENFDPVYFNSDFIALVNEKILNYSSYILFLYQTNNGSIVTTYADILDASNLGFLDCSVFSGSNYMYNFSFASPSVSSLPGWTCRCEYNTFSSAFTVSSATRQNLRNFSRFYGSLNVMYDLFPTPYANSGSTYNSVLVYCNHSLVLSKDNISAGSTLANQSTGIIYNNYYDVIPSVNETVLNENNWENIYNSYVTTVNNEYQTIYDENGSVSVEELRAILKSVGDRIDDIISEAGGEIVENLDDIITWLQRIYERLGLIEEGLSDVSENQADVAEVISSIETIVSGYSTDLARLQQIYVVLGQILNAIPSGGGGGGNINIDIVTDVPDLLEDDVLDLIDKTDVLESALEGVIPFCFIPFAGVIINGLARQPSEAPSFTMPIKLQNGVVDIDVEQEISLEMFDSIHTFYVAGWCILLIISLIFVTFKLFLFINTFI